MTEGGFEPPIFLTDYEPVQLQALSLSNAFGRSRTCIQPLESQIVRHCKRPRNLAYCILHQYAHAIPCVFSGTKCMEQSLMYI